MRKVFVFCMVCSLPFLVSGCGYGQSGNDVGAQEQVGALPSYGFESDVMPMAEIGRVFEEMGWEMQQKQQRHLPGGYLSPHRKRADRVLPQPTGTG